MEAPIRKQDRGAGEDGEKRYRDAWPLDPLYRLVDDERLAAATIGRRAVASAMIFVRVCDAVHDEA